VAHKQELMSNPCDKPVINQNPSMALVPDHTTFTNDKLKSLLEKSDYIAVGGHCASQVKPLLMSLRGGGYRLDDFKYDLGIFESEIGESHRFFTIIGPGDNFTPKFANRKVLETKVKVLLTLFRPSHN